MNVTSLLSLAASKNVSVSVKDGNLIVKGHTEAVAHIKPLLRANKDALLKHFMTKPDNSLYTEIYNERAAILQFDAGFIREEAERLAYQEVLVMFLAECHPVILEQFESRIHQLLIN